MLEQNPHLGHGGTGFQGTGLGSAAKMLAEQQGLNIALLAGAGADTNIQVDAIRPEDTVLSALNNNAGTITDITGTVTIQDMRATGTFTLVDIVPSDTVTVDGVTFTAIDSGTPKLQEWLIGADDDEDAVNLAAAINNYFGHHSVPLASRSVTATSNTNVVTVKAKSWVAAEGNAITISAPPATITASGATLAGGDDLGQIQSSGATDQIILFWFDKQ